MNKPKNKTMDSRPKLPIPSHPHPIIPLPGISVSSLVSALPSGACHLARLVNHPHGLPLYVLRHRLEGGGPREERQEGVHHRVPEWLRRITSPRGNIT